MRGGGSMKAAMRIARRDRLAGPRKQDGDGGVAAVVDMIRGPFAVARETRGRRRRLMFGEDGAERVEVERRSDRLGGIDLKFVDVDLHGRVARFPCQHKKRLPGENL